VRTAIGNPDRDSCNEMCFCKVHICSPMRVTRMLSWRPAYQSCIAPRQGKPTLGRAEEQVLGNSQILDVLDTNNVGMAEAFPVTARSSGQVNSLSLFLDGSNTATMISVGLYTSYHGHPSTLLRQAVITQPLAGRWNSVRIPGVQVTQGKRYWVAVLGLNGQIEFRDSNSNWWCYSETSYQTALTSLPARWRMGSQYPSCLVSMFGSGGVSTSVSVSLSPQTAALQPAQQTQFMATLSGTTDTAVTWHTSGGTVTSGGLYTAPSLNGTYTVTATSSADSTKSASATITVSQSTQVSISVSPYTANIQTGGQQQFTASVLGTSNTGVAWKATAGTVTMSGLYTAPSTAGTYTVTATSAADSTKSASSTITVSQPAQVSISVSPYTANIQTGGQQQFTASVLGTSNTGVAWKANGGTVTTSGLYTAPSTAGTYTVTATSVADSTKSASSTITVSQPAQVSISVSPGSASIQTGGQQQFTAAVLGTSNTGVAWKANGGTVTMAGLYTAPSTAGTYAVTATSAADPTKSAFAAVTVSQPIQVSISVSPGTASLQAGGQQQFTAMISGTSNTAGDVDGIWWHNHDERTVHSAYGRGYLHGHGGQRSKQFDVRFCHGQRVGSTNSFDQHIAYVACNAGKVATAIFCHSFRVRQHWRNLDGIEGHWDDHSIRTVHSTAICRNRRCYSNESG
jgi:hypothetical protein